MTATFHVGDAIEVMSKMWVCFLLQSLEEDAQCLVTEHLPPSRHTRCGWYVLTPALAPGEAAMTGGRVWWCSINQTVNPSEYATCDRSHPRSACGWRRLVSEPDGAVVDKLIAFLEDDGTVESLPDEPVASDSATP